MLFSKKKTIATHNGSFHADDVFAVATLLLAFPKEKFEIIRTRDMDKISKADFVVDVGRIYDPSKQRFDHHQGGGAGKRENGIPYASFGLVWKEYGAKICGTEEVNIVDQGLVSFLDAADNGVDLFESKTEINNYSLASIVAVFNSTSLEENKNDKTFLDIIWLAKKIIEREIASAKEFIYGKEEIKKAYERSNDKRIIILDKKIEKEIVYRVLGEYPNVLFVVHPYQGQWALRGARKEPNSYESRKLLPESWAGKDPVELQKITGVKDILFCHNARFIASAASKEGAIKLAEIALKS